MMPRQIPWKWILLGLASVLIVGIAVVPRYLGDSASLAARVTDALSEWSGGEVKLTGPLKVRYFPDVAIKGGFELTNAARLPLIKSITAKDAKVSLDVAALLLGRLRIDAVRLYSPEIVLKQAPSMVTGPDHTLQARVTNLLRGAPVGVIRVSNGLVRVATASGSEAIENLDARLDVRSGKGAISSFGTLMFRGEKVGYVLNCETASQSGDDLRVPVSLTFNSTPIAAKFTGTARVATGLQLDGNVQAEIPNARSLLRWTGIALPAGGGLQTLTASGPAHWNGTTLTFEDGAFTLDGNAAVGLLAITPGERPRIEGTLDFDRLALEPYIDSGVTPETETAKSTLAEHAILKFFDADLRISAATITAPVLNLGRGGFTISAKGGVIASEVGELELCGGSATGRLGLDLRNEMAKANLTASLSDVPVDGCLAPLAPDVSINGIGGLKAELTSEGRSYDELIQRLAGTFKLNALKGAVPVDLARLLGPAQPIDGDGWSRSSATLYDQLQTDCRLDSGHISCEMFNMQTRRGLISGSGGVDLKRQMIDWDLFVASDTQPLKASQLSINSPPRISISGSLARPTIQRSDRPTLGEGSGQREPAASQVSPR
jgi:AsmA protein